MSVYVVNDGRIRAGGRRDRKFDPLDETNTQDLN